MFSSFVFAACRLVFVVRRETCGTTQYCHLERSVPRLFTSFKTQTSVVPCIRVAGKPCSCEVLKLQSCHEVVKMPEQRRRRCRRSEGERGVNTSGGIQCRESRRCLSIQSKDSCGTSTDSRVSCVLCGLLLRFVFHLRFVARSFKVSLSKFQESKPKINKQNKPELQVLLLRLRRRLRLRLRLRLCLRLRLTTPPPPAPAPPPRPHNSHLLWRLWLRGPRQHRRRRPQRAQRCRPQQPRRPRPESPFIGRTHRFRCCWATGGGDEQMS